MKKHKVMSSLKDIGCILMLRMKLIIKDTTTLVALLSSLLVFSIVIHALSVAAEEHSAIPIGIVDYDKSQESQELIDRLKKVPSLRVIEQSERELKNLLIDEMVNAIFIIEDGYERSIKKGRINEIITVYFMDSDKASSIISDIFAGEMLYPISLYKSFRMYDGLHFEGEKLSEEEYKDYMKGLLADSSDFDFAFRMIYENPERSVEEEKPISNSLIYNQVIVGILGILISFIAMFLMSGIVRDKETGVEERLEISSFHLLKRDAGNFTSVLLVEGAIALVFTGLIYRQLGISELRIYLSACLLIILYAMQLGAIFLLITKLVKSTITYQMLCTIMILVLSGLGFYQLLTGLSDSVSANLLKFIPNSWFIQGFTDIIMYGNYEVLLTQGHRMLLLMNVVILLVIIVLDSIIGGSVTYRIEQADSMNRME